MRCPKCHYLSFEPEPRCKNCGYDFFALTDGDLVVKPEEGNATPAGDVALAKTSGAGRGADDAPDAARDAAATGAPSDVAVPRAVAPRPTRPPITTTDLPLFMKRAPAAGSDADPPTVSVPSGARPPLAVRRRTGDPAASGGQARATAGGAVAGKKAPARGPDLLGDAPLTMPTWATVAPRKAADPPSPAELALSAASVSGARRALAAILDAAILLGIDGAVVWLTLRLCSLTMRQAASLPLLPLLGFFLLLDLGYLLLFTATSGQTVGKMATHIRVVGTSASPLPSPPVTLGQALLRAALSLPAGLVLGAGFWPALAGRGPAVHDRIAHTRVIPE